MNYILFLFYRYYRTGATKDIPYSKSVFAFLFTVILSVINILLILVPDFFRKWNSYYLENPKPLRFGVGLLIAGVILTIFYFVVPENKIKAMMDRRTTRRDGWILVGYIVFSLALFGVLVLYR